MGNMGWSHLEQEVLEWAHTKEMWKRGLKETGVSHVAGENKRARLLLSSHVSSQLLLGARCPKCLLSSQPEEKGPEKTQNLSLMLTPSKVDV